MGKSEQKSMQEYAVEPRAVVAKVSRSKYPLGYDNIHINLDPRLLAS